MGFLVKDRPDLSWFAKKEAAEMVVTNTQTRTGWGRGTQTDRQSAEMAVGIIIERFHSTLQGQTI